VTKSDGPELLVAALDLDEVDRAQKSLPWWRDRRPDLYGRLTSRGTLR
jgi:N-carbamoylputrescine amidase